MREKTRVLCFSSTEVLRKVRFSEREREGDVGGKTSLKGNTIGELYMGVIYGSYICSGGIGK